MTTPKLTKAQREALETGRTWSTNVIDQLVRAGLARCVGPGCVEATAAGRAALKQGDDK